MAYGHFKSLVNGVDKPTFFTGGAPNPVGR